MYFYGYFDLTPYLEEDIVRKEEKGTNLVRCATPNLIVPVLLPKPEKATNRGSLHYHAEKGPALRKVDLSVCLSEYKL